MKRIVLALAALALTPPAAIAQDGSLLGRWNFRTGPHPETQCVIAGTADFAAGPARGAINVTLTAHETCPGDDRLATALEACAGVGAQKIEFFCEVREVNSSNYAPDNFFLERAGRDVLTGRLNDFNYWNVPVRFERHGDGALIS